MTNSFSVFAQLKPFPFLKCISEIAPMVYVQPNVWTSKWEQAMERLVMQKINLRSMWKVSVMRQVTLKLSSLSFGITRCCWRKGWLPLPVQAACFVWVLTLWFWRGFGWVSFHLDQVHVPACPQTHKHFCWEETVVRTGTLVWNKRWNNLPCKEMGQARGLQNHHVHRDGRESQRLHPERAAKER